MARGVLGSLVVSLGLEAAEFTAGLTKAEYDAKRAKDRISKELDGIKSAVAGLGALGVSLSVAGIAAFAADVVHAAAALDDMAESTGATVEELSRFDRVAKLTGSGSIDEVSGALQRLVRSMQGADDEAKGAGAAFAYLGIQTRDQNGALRSSGQVLEDVARALAKYEDGAGKVALAQQLFGKTGAQLLPFLKELAERGDIVGKVNAEQAAAAERLEKQWRELVNAGSDLKTMILNDVVPALSRMIKEFTDGIAIAGSFKDALLLFGTTNPFKSLEDNLKGATAEVERLQSIKAQGGVFDPKTFKQVDQAIDDATKRLKFFRAQFAAGIDTSNAGMNPRDLIMLRKPQADFRAPSTEKTAKAQKEAQSQAEKYLESLQKQLERTQDLTVAEQLLADVRSGRLKLDSSKVSFEQLDALAREIDQRIALKKQLQEEAQIRERTSQMTTRSQENAAREIDQLAEGNEQFKEQIALIGADAKKRSDLEKAHIESAIAKKQDALASLQLADGDKVLIAQMEQQIELLKQRKDLIGQRDAAVQVAEEAAKAKRFADDLGFALAQGAEDAIIHFNSLRDVLKNLEQDLLRIITRKLVTEPLGNFLSDFFGNAIKGFAVGGASGFSGTGFANGTSFAPGGWSRVGEHGPETMFVPRGTQITPAGRTPKSNVVNISVNVMPGATRASADQAAMATGIHVQRALARNG